MGPGPLPDERWLKRSKKLVLSVHIDITFSDVYRSNFLTQASTCVALAILGLDYVTLQAQIQGPSSCPLDPTVQRVRYQVSSVYGQSLQIALSCCLTLGGKGIQIALAKDPKENAWQILKMTWQEARTYKNTFRDHFEFRTNYQTFDKTCMLHAETCNGQQKSSHRVWHHFL